MGAVELGSTAGYNEWLMWLEKRMVGGRWKKAGFLGPPETPQMVAVLMGSLIEDSQGIIFSSSPFQREMEEGSTIQLEIKKDFKAMVQAET